MASFTRTFWTETAERALKTAAQVAITLLTTWQIALNTTSALDFDWSGFFIAVGLAALLSVLTSIVSGSVSVGAAGSPSLVETSGRHAA